MLQYTSSFNNTQEGDYLRLKSLRSRGHTTATETEVLSIITCFVLASQLPPGCPLRRRSRDLPSIAPPAPGQAPLVQESIPLLHLVAEQTRFAVTAFVICGYGKAPRVVAEHAILSVLQGMGDLGCGDNRPSLVAQQARFCDD